MRKDWAQGALEDAFAAHPIGVKPRLIWKNYRVTAGTAHCGTWTIALSQLILESEEQVRVTVLHEYAHLLAVYRHGRKAANHGRAWRQAMADLGLDPIVTHRYPVIRNQPSENAVEYICEKCGTVITRRRRLSRSKLWSHRGCGGLVKLRK